MCVLATAVITDCYTSVLKCWMRHGSAVDENEEDRAKMLGRMMYADDAGAVLRGREEGCRIRRRSW